MTERAVFDVRKYKRLNLTKPLLVRIRTNIIKLRSDEEIEGVIGNISAGGAMLVSPIFIPRGAIVEIEISPFDGLSTSLKTSSRVAHCKEQHTSKPTPLPTTITPKIVHVLQVKITSSDKEKDKHIYHMGVEFLDMSDEIHSLINKWVEAST